MVSLVESNLSLLLKAMPYEEMFEFCDFSLSEQNEAALSKGIQPAIANDFR